MPAMCDAAEKGDAAALKKLIDGGGDVNELGLVEKILLDAPKDTTTVNKIWELCGFKSKEEFEKNFKTIYGTSFKDYISKL